MNFTKYILISLIALGSASAWAQSTDKESNKVQIFTYEEKANLQNWFQQEIQRMELSQEQEADYSSVITYYIAKIARLDDKDQEYTREEFKAKLEEYLVKQDMDLKEILSDEQFTIHKEIYGEFLRSAYKRWGIEEN
ncbi:MAG: hypothetical protein WBM43_03425 [Flavobacteriaceae bacterium]